MTRRHDTPRARGVCTQSPWPPAPKHDRQTLMFSATFPASIQQLAREFLRNYTWIGVGRVGSTVSAITQTFELATHNKQHKLELLMVALAKVPDQLTLVFVQKKRTASWVAGQLSKGHGIKAESIHGDRSQSQREAALASFKSGASPVMVATDVAARGIDVPGIGHVINFDMPTTADDFDSYVHRIGRTGRAGREGLSTSFFVPGFEPKSGNGKIASLLATLLKESGGVIPDYLANAGAGGGTATGGVGGGGAAQQPPMDARAPAARGGRQPRGGPPPPIASVSVDPILAPPPQPANGGGHPVSAPGAGNNRRGGSSGNGNDSVSGEGSHGNGGRRGGVRNGGGGSGNGGGRGGGSIVTVFHSPGASGGGGDGGSGRGGGGGRGRGERGRRSGRGNRRPDSAPAPAGAAPTGGAPPPRPRAPDGGGRDGGGGGI